MKVEIENKKMLATQTMSSPLAPETAVQSPPTTNSAIPNFPVNRNPGSLGASSSQPKNKNIKRKK